MIGIRWLGGPDAACRLESIQVRHETGEKEKIVGLLREGLRTACHHIDPMASPFEQPDDEHLIGPVVISQENALSLLGARLRKRMTRDESSLTGMLRGTVPSPTPVSTERPPEPIPPDD